MTVFIILYSVQPAIFAAAADSLVAAADWVLERGHWRTLTHADLETRANYTRALNTWSLGDYIIEEHTLVTA